jgi:hypothetical protein
MFLVFVFVARNNYAASNESSTFDPQQLFDGNIESQYELNRQMMREGFCDKKVQSLLMRYRADLPTYQQASQHVEAVISRHPEWASDFSRKIHHLQNPQVYKSIRYPSRMVYHGPSGCSKTFTALALAKICNMECLLIHGSSIETSYRRSGPDFLDNLFQTLLDYPERRFLIVLDELKYLAQYSKNERETDQHATVIKLWQCLDQIEKERHICVIGTDNLDPKEYEPQMQTRFFNSIFKFNQTDMASATRLSLSVLSSIIDNRSSSNASSSLSTSTASASSEQSIHSEISSKPITWSFSEKRLNDLSAGVAHLTDREKLELIDTAAEIAIFQTLNTPSDYSEVIITEDHVKEAYRKHHRSNLQRFLSHPVVQQLYSVRALSYYVAAASFGLRMIDTAYTPYSMQLLAVAQLINALDTEDKDRTHSLQLFGALHNHVANQESDYRYHYALKCEQDAINRDAERYEQSRMDRTAVLKRDACRYKQSRDDYDEDLSRDVRRYAQSREDRKSQITRQLKQSENLHYISLRGNYIKNLDIPMHTLDQRLKAARSIENTQERSVVVEQLWRDFEKDLIIETNNRYHEISHNKAIRGRVFQSDIITAIKQFYTEHGRELPADMELYVRPANLLSRYR